LQDAFFIVNLYALANRSSISDYGLAPGRK